MVEEIERLSSIRYLLCGQAAKIIVRYCPGCPTASIDKNSLYKYTEVKKVHQVKTDK